ncbi:S-layer family protein, partial [Campylobacter novaezeelandiae]|uniref:beta strand repeat-containing protein n=1 Tax=Campylobacter novaezeelandiae TaxID=2267891 RepID=UPI0010370879
MGQKKLGLFKKETLGGGELKKSHSSSKKLALSLVTISFLSSYSYATTNSKTYDDNLKSKSSSVYSPQAKSNTTIKDSQTNTHTVSGSGNTLVVESGGSVIISTPANNQAVSFTQNSSTTTFLNKGTLIGGNNTSSVQVGVNNSGGATIQTFENSGIIGNSSSRFGVVIWGKNDNKSSITNFNNSGTINSNNGEAIYIGNANVSTFKNEGTISSNNGHGINIASGASIANFINSGTIKSDNRYGVSIGGGATITSFTNETNGIIQGKSDFGAININNGTVQTLVNRGTIKNVGTREPSNFTEVSTGVFLQNGTINNFTNESNGLISGIMGVSLNASTINNFTNKGTIQSTSSNELSAAINLSAVSKSKSTIENFTNEGLVQSNSHGILVETGNSIETLINKGTIDASLNGLSFYGFSHLDDGTTNIGKITLDTGSIIKAGNNGINIDGSDKDIVGEGIDVKGRLEGGNAGIYIGGGKNLKTSITVSGTIQGGNGGIINTGTIGQKDAVQQQHGITIENGGTITSTNGKGILNTDNGIIYGNIINQSNNDLTLKNDSSATITSGITNNGNGTIFVNNQGTISKDDKGYNLTNNGFGSIVIEDWLVTSDKDGNLDTIVVGGSNTGNVSADNITIDESNLDLDNLDHISDVITGINNNNVSNITTNGSGDINLIYDPTTGKIYQSFNLNASISG